MSIDEIAHLDWNPDTGLGLRERALEAWRTEEAIRDQEHQENAANLLLAAAACISEVLGVLNAANTRVVPSKTNKDGDGDVFCEIDGIEFKVTVVYPSGGGDEPSRVGLSVKNRSNGWMNISTLEQLGKYLDSDTIHPFVDRSAE